MTATPTTPARPRPSAARTHRVPAPDGALLATDVQLPAGPGPFTTVLIRTPYGRTGHRAELAGWARHGFAAVAQDVRGRHDSDGDWRPYTTEDRDGTATARWIRR
ncbi:CocE/NonD family hydrolase, partial [Streptomyces alkaliterrae]